MTDTTPEQIAETLAADGWTMEATVTDPGKADHCINGRTVESGKPSTHRVKLTRGQVTHEMDYHKGCGLRRNKVRRDHLGRTTKLRETEPVPVTLDEAVWSLYMDAQTVAHGQTFADFCADYGYDEDSRKAEATFNACRDQWAALVRLGGDLDALSDLFADY